MNNKIKVNATIARMLEIINVEQADCSIEWKVSKFLNKVNSDRGFSETFGEYFQKNNITITDIEKAFKYGFEEEYQFKTGDVLWNTQRDAMSIVEESNPTHIEANFVRPHHANKYKDRYVLICKAENREDNRK